MSETHRVQVVWAPIFREEARQPSNTLFDALVSDNDTADTLKLSDSMPNPALPPVSPSSIPDPIPGIPCESAISTHPILEPMATGRRPSHLKMPTRASWHPS